MRWCSKAVGLSLLLGLGLAACQDNLERRDTISLAAGDAIEANKAIHIIDPWPPGSSNTAIPTSARRVADAIERYETRADARAPAGPIAIAPLPIAPGPAVAP